MKGSTKFFFIGLLVFAFLAYWFLIRKPDTSKGTPAPDFETQLVDGQSFKISDLKGSYVLLDFWGSWCPPCRRDNPNLVAIYDRYNGQSFKGADGFEVVTIALEKDGKRWEAAAKKDGFKWPYQIVQESRFVLTAPLAKKYGVSDVPAKFLIDPQGHIILSNPTNAEIKSYLDKQRA